ncbi:MAG: efflux RND transporter permease subunit [Mucinivorans sp.]
MIEKLIHRPIAVSMCVVALVVLGVVAMRLLPISLMPEVDIPQVTVKVGAPNTSARQLHNTVVTPLRQALMQTPHLKEIRATAKDGSATIFMLFDYGTDIDYTFIDVNERVDRAMSGLPKEVERPMVVKASATDMPAFFLNVSLRGGNEGGDNPTQEKVMELGTFASTVVAKRLEQLGEVAFVDISGRQQPQLVITPDMNRLTAMGVGIDVLEGAISAANINLGNLTIRDGQYSYNLRFSSTLQTKSDIENVTINIENRLYRLGELAVVESQPQPRSEIVRSDGDQAITMAIIKQSDARMDDLQGSIKWLTEQMERDYPNLRFVVTRDQTALLDYSIGNLESNLLVGGLLACLVIFLFMQDLRTPLLVTLTIPLSFLLSLLLFFVMGLTINIVSLSGLMLGLGMMVDNSIIVIDNISQRWDRGETLAQAVTRGTGEVFAALLSSVMTTCSIFLPLIFLSGVAGAMFYDQAMAVTIGLVSSLAVAMTIIPVYYYLLYKKKTRRVKNRFVMRFGIPEMVAPYERSLKWVFRHQTIFWVVTVVITLSAFAILPLIEKRGLPEVEQTDVMIRVNWNEPLTVEENDARVTQMLQSLNTKPNHHTTLSGQHSFSLGHTPENNREDAQIYMLCDSEKELMEAIDQARQFVGKQYPKALFSTTEAGNIFNMIFSQGGAPLVAHLRPTDGGAARPDKLNPLLGAISQNLKQVYIEPVAWQEHITLYPDRALLSLYKVEPSALYAALQRAFNEKNILRLNQGSQTLPVIIGGEPQTLRQILATLTVRTQDKTEIPVNLLVRESADRDLRSIVSGSEGDFYPLELQVADNRVSQTMKNVQEVVESNSDFEVSFSGEWFEGREMMSQLIMVMIVALLLLYFILASQFESLIQPLIILSEIAIDLSGAIFVLWVFGQSLNLMSMIGLIVMSGIVINDSILKVDTFNRLRGGNRGCRNGNQCGMGTLRAVLTGGERRLKPIIMTSLTTIMAIVPFLFSGGMGNDLQRPLSLVIIGGMIIGTIFSIYGIPLIYYYIYRRGNRSRRIKEEIN